MSNIKLIVNKLTDESELYLLMKKHFLFVVILHFYGWSGYLNPV